MNKIKKYIKKQGVILPVFNNKTFPYLLVTAFLVITLLLLIQTYNRALKIPYGNDFTLFLEASKKFFELKNPYDKYSIFDFLYPQTLCVIVYPLTIINYKISILIWFSGSFLALLMTFKESIKFINKLPNIKYSIFFILFITLFAIIQDNFLNGQINFIVLYLCILFFKYLQKSKNVLAAVFLSLAIAIKLTPIIFLIFLIPYGKIKIILFTLLFSLVLILILPVTVTNLEFVLANYKHYINSFILHRTTNFQESNLHSGFSLTMFLSNFFDKYVIFISTIISIGYVFYFQLKNKGFNFLIFSGYLFSILLISPMSEGHHLILAFPMILIFIFKRNNIKINLFAVMFFIIASSINNTYLIFSSLLVLYIGLILNLLEIKKSNNNLQKSERIS